MTRRRRWPAALAMAGAMAVAAACGGTSSPGKVTIEFATQGLGSEGAASRKAVDAFNKANPNIQVTMVTLSSTHLTQRFIAGSPTPDVITSDVIWPATFAKSGWIQPLDRFNPNRSAFFDGQIQGGTYNGKLYAIPWFINAEGLYYRTDLVSRAPTSPQGLVRDAQSALQRHPTTLREGLAFTGDNYEGLVASFITFAGGFGGTLDLNRIASNQNVQALTYMRNLIYSDRVTPQAATSWQEPDVERAYLGGQTVFAMDGPYVLAEAQTAAAVKGKTAWIPFPSQSGPKSALGGQDLVVNAESRHADAAYKFIQYLTSSGAQIDRALTAGDPPAVRSAYSDRLFSRASYFKEEEKVFNVVTPPPVTPLYPQVSTVLQTQLNAALSNQISPQAALTAAQQQINQIVGSSG